MSNKKPVVGDKVKITLEGEVTWTGDCIFAVNHGHSTNMFELNDDTEIEILSPPVVQFSPGDIVKDKIGKYKYTVLPDGRWLDHGSLRVFNNGYFTDENYVLIGKVER